MHDAPIPIQILAAKEGASPAGRAVAIAREHLPLIADVARAQRAEALLICPAPDEYVDDGFNLVIAARFGKELDEDAVFWQQLALSNAIHAALRVESTVLNFDGPIEGLLKSIAPLLACPYRDEIGRRGAAGPPSV